MFKQTIYYDNFTGPFGDSRRMYLAPGIGLILFGLLIIFVPEIIVFLISTSLIFVGVSLLYVGWKMRTIVQREKTRVTDFWRF